MIVGENGPGVVLSARTCAWLEQYSRLASMRAMTRGTDPAISTQLEEIRRVAEAWFQREVGTGSEGLRRSERVPGTAVAGASEPAPRSLRMVVSSAEAGQVLGISPRAVVKAIARGDLPNSQMGPDGRWQIDRDDVKHYRARLNERNDR